MRSATVLLEEEVTCYGVRWKTAEEIKARPASVRL